MRGKIDVRAIALLVMVSLLGAACGSTVPAEDRQAVQLAGGAELGTDLSGGLPAGAHVNAKGQVVSASGEVLGTAEDFGISTGSGGGVAGGSGGSGASEGSGIASGESGGSGTAGAARAPGITDSKIYFGIGYAESGPANQAAFGQPLDADARKANNTMIEIINKQGGLFGREVVPIYYKFDAASSQTVSQQEQAACAHWTEDNEVFAILEGSPVLRECAKRAGAINSVPYGASLPEHFDQYPYYFETSGLDLVRVGPVTVTGLARQGYFKGEPKIGVVTWDDPTYRASLERGFIPALTSKGIELATEPAYITSPQTAQDLGATSADINSAVLRFQTQGITHVLLVDGPSGLCSNACMGTLFLRRADSQEYFPRYGFNTNNVAIAALEQGLYPARQLRRSMSVEWWTLDKSYDEGWKINQARERCYKLMRDAGVPMDNTNRQYTARAACEQFWFYQVIEKILGNAPLTANNFMVAVNRVASGYPSTNAFAVHLSATQHDGIAAARNAEFDEECGCYKFTSDPYRV